MDLKKDYSKAIIVPLELEIKNVKMKMNKKINFTRDIDKEYLTKLQDLLNHYYKKYYELNNK